MSPEYFHFTIGPVQTFVAQARRTRDYWAGSFLLSWVSAVAMKAVHAQGGHIVFPIPDEDFLTEPFIKALSEPGKDGPKQGTVPNRFKAEVPKGFKPELVTEAVQAAWQTLTDKIWQGDLATPLKDNPQEHRDIWDRQLTRFWDMQWALVNDAHNSDAIDRLKNWRTHLPPDEPGIKCSLMDGWQELSNLPRPDRKALDAFWERIRNSKNNLKADLTEQEALCAMAFVKRRFARYFEDFEHQFPDWTLYGWALPVAQPSTYYLAAAHWLAELIEAEDTTPKALDRFYDAAKDLDAEKNEWSNELLCVEQARTRSGLNWKQGKKFVSLDSGLFFHTTLDNLLNKEQKQAAKPALEALKTLTNQAGKDLSPSPFYALLLMDGDGLGIQMSNPDNQGPIAKALSAFTQGVASRVREHSGFLIYAGGDDVLALLPLEDALPCAQALRKHYQGCFQQHAAEVETGLSGAVEYAHVKVPLAKILADAHPLLDDLAKDGRGRDAIACRVWKPGGLAAEWAMPWELAIPDGRMVLTDLATQFATQNDKTSNKLPGELPDEPGLASAFFHRLEHHFEVLGQGSDASNSILSDVLSMELLHSGLSDHLSFDQAREHITPLLDQCQARLRNPQIPPKDWPRLPPTPNAAMLVKFLASKGVDA